MLCWSSINTCPSISIPYTLYLMIKIGNGSIVQVLFVIPLLFMFHGHLFEIYTIVADIDDGIDLVFGFKNMVETEGMLNTRTREFDFLGRSLPIFPKHDLDVKPGSQAYLKVRIQFVEKLSGRALCKMLAGEINHGLFQSRLSENGNHG